MANTIWKEVFLIMCSSSRENARNTERFSLSLRITDDYALNDNDSDSLIENVSVASLRDNTVYYSDSVKQTFQMKPYVFPKTDELAAYIDRLSLGGEL